MIKIVCWTRFSLKVHSSFEQTTKTAKDSKNRNVQEQTTKSSFWTFRKKQIKPIKDNKQLSLNLPELIRLRTFVWVQFKQEASFLNWIAARVQRETDDQKSIFTKEGQTLLTKNK